MRFLFYPYLPSFVFTFRFLFFLKYYFEYPVFVGRSNCFDVCYPRYIYNLIFSLWMITGYLHRLFLLLPLLLTPSLRILRLLLTRGLSSSSIVIEYPYTNDEISSTRTSSCVS